MSVVRYEGSGDIKSMADRGEYVMAFAYTQQGIEKILWDKIVGVFQSPESSKMRIRIAELKKRQIYVTTLQLIYWAFIVGAIKGDELDDLKSFNSGRNSVVHGHGNWWSGTEFRKV